MTKNLFLTKIIWFCGIDKQIIWIAFLKFCQKSYENQKTWFCKHLKYGLNMKWQDNNPTSIVKAVLLLEKQASLIDYHAELKKSSIDFFSNIVFAKSKKQDIFTFIRIGWSYVLYSKDLCTSIMPNLEINGCIIDTMHTGTHPYLKQMQLYLENLQWK